LKGRHAPPQHGLSRRNVLAAAAGLVAASTTATSAQDADWPTRPVRVVVGWPPGGTADTVARVLFTETSQRIQQQFVVDNRTGATGMIGSAFVASAAPDGYTVLYGTTPLSTAVLFPQLAFDPARDLIPVFQAAIVPQLLLTHPSVAARSVAELIAEAKANPGRSNWASAGSGGVQHLALELFARRAGIEVNHVPYRGGGPATNDLLAGQVKHYFGNADTAIAFVKSGRLRALCHTGKDRLAALPNLPPLSDTLPGFETYEWNGVFVPAGTSRPIVEKLNRLLNETIATPAVAERLKSADLQAQANTPEQFARFFQEQSSRWQAFIREANIRLE
jgi:tripartite-type tricarboxylate transporter receptor subunit TctC